MMGDRSATILFLFFLTLSLADGQSIWPKPRSQQLKDDVYLIDKDFKFVLKEGSPRNCRVVNKAIERYQDMILTKASCRRNSTKKRTRNIGPIVDISDTIRTLSVVFKDCPKYPTPDMDEVYVLSTFANFEISADTSWGILRGLESFSQLVYPAQITCSDNQGLTEQRLAVNGTSILDYPRYAYRGILLDTSRHYIPVEILKENLDAMSFNKMNVFHWHIVDDQAFPYVSQKFPHLSQEGSYDPETHVYSPNDVKDIIEYGRDRGIRVLPEFDTPGHALSWGSQPNLLTTCFNTSTGKPDGTFGPIDPTKKSNYHFLYDFFAEVKATFPDAYVHLGGDEVDFTCWKSNPEITTFMHDEDIKTYEELESYYLNTLITKIRDLNMSYIVWQEVFDNGVKIDKESTLVNVWKWYGDHTWPEEMARVTKKGYKVILSAPWYLNYIHYGPDWRTYYDSDPENFEGSHHQKGLIIGGSACMWAEYVDGSGLISRLWPRASAVAERLWSPKTFNSSVEALPRIKKMQCLMQQRGLRVSPIEGPDYCLCDHTFN